MKSLKWAGGMMVMMAAFVPAVALIVTREIEAQAAGIRLAVWWRLAGRLAEWYLSWELTLATVGVALVATTGAVASRHARLAEERRALLAWLILCLALNGLVVVGSYGAFSGYSDRTWFLRAFELMFSFGGVAFFMAVGIAVHVQSRLAIRGSRCRGWHVGLASALLLCVLPFAVVPAVLVWWRSGRSLASDPAEAEG